MLVPRFCAISFSLGYAGWVVIMKSMSYGLY